MMQRIEMKKELFFDIEIKSQDMFNKLLHDYKVSNQSQRVAWQLQKTSSAVL